MNSDFQKTSDGLGKNQPNPHRERVFATTSWSMVLKAADAGRSDEGEVSAALSELCQSYWFPLYSLVRFEGFNANDAEDLTQEFFAEILAKNRLKLAERARGRFRAFLRSSMTNFIHNFRRSQKTLKRGGGQPTLSLDFQHGEDRYSSAIAEQVSNGDSAEKIFERNWAFSVLEQTMSAVQQQYETTGKQRLFEELRGSISGNNDVPYDLLAEKLGMRTGAVKVAVHRLRQRYAQQLRLQIAKTVENAEDVDEELKSLFAALA